MYLKLALRNIRRSVRDYAIYFITLLFGVAVFYAFNSIGSQKILFDMETSASQSVFDSTTYILGMFSVVVACVLGFLILYANQFLIRRRKREFGTYLVLGMTPGHVSRIVLYETVLVGLLSLAVGLICGILLSQGLSFFTAALFGTTMSNYQFVFSPDAFLVTLACFAAIYVVVALFNTITVSRCKLIDLIARPHLNLTNLSDIIPDLKAALETPANRKEEITEAAEIKMKYKGYIERERLIADKMHRLEDIKIKGRFNYSELHEISTEGRQKLERIDPETLAQASRIPGVSPSDINVMLVLLGR